MHSKLLAFPSSHPLDPMPRESVVHLGTRPVGDGYPVFVIAEIGINHNGDLNLARELITVAAESGFDAVKFQKRSPELCVSPGQFENVRVTPWGKLSELEYRRIIELSREQYAEIDTLCKGYGIPWFASCWDLPSVDFIGEFDPVCFKVASASLTDAPLLRHLASLGKPVILSTGMSTLDQIRNAVEIFAGSEIIVTHSTSSYPCSPEEQNLRMIETLRSEFVHPVGYSGHESDIETTLAAVALGACCIERHITLSRTLWGSNHAASLEPQEATRLIEGIRRVERALGDGVKRIYASELPALRRLRRSSNTTLAAGDLP